MVDFPERDHHGTGVTQAFELITTRAARPRRGPGARGARRPPTAILRAGHEGDQAQEGHAPQERRLRRARDGGRDGDAGGSEALRPHAASRWASDAGDRGPPHRAAGSPEWWLARLLARLGHADSDLETFEAYYDGHQPLAFASQKFRDAFGSRFREFSSNFMSLGRGRTRRAAGGPGVPVRRSPRATRTSGAGCGRRTTSTRARSPTPSARRASPTRSWSRRRTASRWSTRTRSTASSRWRPRTAGSGRGAEALGRRRRPPGRYLHLPDAVFKYRSLGKAAPVVTATCRPASWRSRPPPCAGPAEVRTSPGRCPTRWASCPWCRCPTGHACRVAPGP